MKPVDFMGEETAFALLFESKMIAAQVHAWQAWRRYERLAEALRARGFRVLVDREIDHRNHGGAEGYDLRLSPLGYSMRAHRDEDAPAWVRVLECMCGIEPYVMEPVKHWPWRATHGRDLAREMGAWG